jgi:hypothetical protein
MTRNEKGPRDASDADAAEKDCNNGTIACSEPEGKAVTATSSAQQNKPSGPRPVTICLADVTPKPVRWLWPNRIPLGKLTLVFGDPNLGKSFVTLDIAARLSTGKPWPDLPGVENVPAGTVLLSAEDDLSDTIRPRLAAAGADLSRVKALEGIRLSEGAQSPTSSSGRMFHTCARQSPRPKARGWS